MGTDHWGHFGVNEAIKIARAVEPYNLAYIEDIIPWHYTDQWREITESSTTPTQTGEDIFTLEGGFRELIDRRAVDIVHPDPNTAGGILETKRIGDYASMNGVGFMHHHAAGPVSFLGSVHSAAATENFMWLEHHAVDKPQWEDLVTGIEKPIVQDGYVKVPETPGIGVELNEEVVKEYLVRRRKALRAHSRMERNPRLGPAMELNLLRTTIARGFHPVRTISRASGPNPTIARDFVPCVISIGPPARTNAKEIND